MDFSCLVLGNFIKKWDGPYEGYGERLIQAGWTSAELMEAIEGNNLCDLLGISNPLHKNVINSNLKCALSDPSKLQGKLCPPAAAGGVEVIPFPKEGIALSAIDDFVRSCGGEGLFRGLSTTDVNVEVLKPMTYLNKSSYCDLIGERGTGSPIAFISHAWKYSFLDVISALKDHFKYTSEGDTVNNNVIIWFDLFTNNQHDAPDLDFTWWSTTFKIAIQDIGRTVMVLSPWTDPIPFTRAWCLFEVYCTIDTGSMFEVAMDSSQCQDFINVAQKDITTFRKMIGDIDVQKSEAWNPKDLERIFEVVRKTVGFDHVNSLVLSKVREWVIQTLQSAILVQVSKPSTDSINDKELVVAGLHHTLGLLYMEQGMLKEAEDLISKCLEVSSVLCADDRYIVTTRKNNLAIVLDSQGRFDEALILFKECLEEHRAMFGDNHIDTNSTKASVGVVYIHLRVYDLALPLLEEAHTFFQISSLPNSPSALSVMYNLAVAYDTLGRVDEAVQLFEDLMKILIPVLGQSHFDTLRCMASLGYMYHKLQRYEDGLYLLEKVVALKRVKIGLTHPSTIHSTKTLAFMYQKLQVFYRAAELLRESFEAAKKSTTISLKETLDIGMELGIVLLNHENIFEALAVFEWCQKVCAELFVESPEHPQRVRCTSAYQKCVNLAHVVNEFPERVSHPAHQHELVKLMKSPYGASGFSCDLCNQSFPSHVCLYHCDDCGFDLDPMCAMSGHDDGITSPPP